MVLEVFFGVLFFLLSLKAIAAVPFTVVTGIMPVHSFCKQVKRIKEKKKKKEAKFFQARLNYKLTDSCYFLPFWGMPGVCFPPLKYVLPEHLFALQKLNHC